MTLRIKSCFKDELMKYHDFQLASGVQHVSIERYMNYFDDFINKMDVHEICFTKEMCDEWIKPRPYEHGTTTYIRVNWSIGFLRYLNEKGYDLEVPRRLKYVSSSFTAYIYSDDEIQRYFKAIDSYYSDRDPCIALCLPVIFRILYCCGTRIGETLCLKVKDVDLENGILYPRKTKNKKERAVPVGDDLLALLRSYAEKCNLIKYEDDYFFSRRNGDKYSELCIYNWHRKALDDAGIVYVGNRKGPRLHDWRHTFCVTSLSNFDKQGCDLYNVLPILMFYVGHSGISSTEKYLQLCQQHFSEVTDKTEKTTDYILVENENEEEKKK